MTSESKASVVKIVLPAVHGDHLYQHLTDLMIVARGTQKQLLREARVAVLDGTADEELRTFVLPVPTAQGVATLLTNLKRELGWSNEYPLSVLAAVLKNAPA